MKLKRHLTRQEEFDILKLILDKFLWIGVALMGYGFYRIVESPDTAYGFLVMTGGAVILLIFLSILVREYHFMRN